MVKLVYLRLTARLLDMHTSLSTKGDTMARRNPKFTAADILRLTNRNIGSAEKNVVI